MRSIRGVYQLPRDTDPVSRLPQTAFENIPHAQFAPDLLHIDRAVLVSEAGIARDDEQAGKPRQRSYDLFDNPVGEIILRGVAAHIGEWQNGDGRAIRQRQSV